MGDTYVQAYFHLVFAVKYKQALIQRSWKNKLEQYITGIVQKNNHKLIAISAMPDHIHIFIGYNLNQTIPDLVENIKTYSNIWINKEHFSKVEFYWQEGYGAFTHPHSHINIVCDYIINQESHHNKRTFKEEYIEILKKYRIPYNNKYLFTFFDDVYSWK